MSKWNHANVQPRGCRVLEAFSLLFQLCELLSQSFSHLAFTSCQKSLQLQIGHDLKVNVKSICSMTWALPRCPGHWLILSKSTWLPSCRAPLPGAPDILMQQLSCESSFLQGHLPGIPVLPAHMQKGVQSNPEALSGPGHGCPCEAGQRSRHSTFSCSELPGRNCCGFL